MSDERATRDDERDSADAGDLEGERSSLIAHHSSLEDVYWRDEILQVMYWMLGEGIGDRVTAADLARFLTADAALVAAQLQRLTDEGDLALVGIGGNERGYKLTVRGAREGARRFADEFAGMQFGGHGECNNPRCACLDLGPEACISRVGQPA